MVTSGEKGCHRRNLRRIGRENSDGISVIDLYKVAVGLLLPFLGRIRKILRS